ncbi:hypothetical protein DMC30DRAFT_418892 [Rhodotorula diobovata]|uniref:Uncharacterized protein n=1 Tax=Rhodotorula diobovata TaxID=5288 RepID=A0A5C5FRH6_9BASI|nr:hypothetical protein DMC30DRAFT_418892 [Rhodotorula diobovata]
MLLSTLLTLGGVALAFACDDNGAPRVDDNSAGFLANVQVKEQLVMSNTDSSPDVDGKPVDSGDNSNDGDMFDLFDLLDGFSKGFTGKEGPDGRGGEWTRRIVKA